MFKNRNNSNFTYQMIESGLRGNCLLCGSKTHFNPFYDHHSTIIMALERSSGRLLNTGAKKNTVFAYNFIRTVTDDHWTKKDKERRINKFYICFVANFPKSF